MEYNNHSNIERLEKGMNSLGIHLSEGQIRQFIDYYELLIQWNKVMNLTAITEFNEVIDKHFIDSVSIVIAHRPEKERILDMGTGAGFPGIPIKIVFPETEIVLLDSLNKRIQFLNEVIQKLNLKKVSAIHGRAEDYGRDKKYRETFDLCVSRAVAKLSTLAEYCLPFVKVEGFFIPYKSGTVDEEVDSAINSLHILGAEIKEKHDFILPDTEIERTLIVVKKIRHTLGRYPRSAGKPTKEPL